VILSNLLKKIILFPHDHLLGEVVLNAMLSNRFVDISGHALEAWLCVDGKAMCSAHFRADACRVRRCKHSHAHSVALMSNVQHVESDENGAECEPCAMKVNNISELLKGDYEKLIFLFFDGYCIYDHANRSNWEEWSGGFKLHRRESDADAEPKLTALSAIQEVDYCHEDIVDGKSSGRSKSDTSDALADSVGIINLQAKLSCLKVESDHITWSVLDLPSSTIHRILSFVMDADLCQLYACCKAIEYLIVSDELLNYRRKAYLSSICLTGKEISKLKKQEKKKKTIAANAKVLTKKDAYKCRGTW
jgi:hypothetical protein